MEDKPKRKLIKDKNCIGCENLCKGCKGKPRDVVNCLNYKEIKKDDGRV